MNVDSSEVSVLARADSFLSNKLFLYLIIFSFSRSWLEQRHSLLKAIPFLSAFFGLLVAIAMLVLISVLSALEYVWVSAKKAFFGLGKLEVKVEVVVKPYHFIVIALMVVFVAVVF